MAETTDSRGIRQFWPDDDENTMYISSSWMDPTISLDVLLERAMEKWGDGIRLDQLQIEAKHIHTDCLGYDRYDSGDYTDFLVISRKTA